jgi:hypothetical protein
LVFGQHRSYDGAFLLPVVASLVGPAFCKVGLRKGVDVGLCKASTIHLLQEGQKEVFDDEIFG